MLTNLIALFLTASLAQAGPLGTFSTSGSINVDEPLISFKNGNIGVNFLGYHASAGLGKFLTGNAADGGLHAEAGTPYGQAAGAGLGGGVNANGRAGGGLYAGATAGGGVSAGAGLEGVAGSEGTYGHTYSGASSLGGGITKVSGKVIVPAAYSKNIQVVSQHVPEVAHKEVHVISEAKPVTTYVEKTIQVPSYVEKTIRVPTVVEQKIQVPVTSTIIEKTVASQEVSPGFATWGSIAAIPSSRVKVVEKTKIHHHPHHVHAHHKNRYVNHGYIGYGGVGGGIGGDATSAGSGVYKSTITKTVNPQLYQDAINIPIATLNAVKQLLGGISSGASGSFGITKSFSATV